MRDAGAMPAAKATLSMPERVARRQQHVVVAEPVGGPDDVAAVLPRRAQCRVRHAEELVVVVAERAEPRVLDAPFAGSRSRQRSAFRRDHDPVAVGAVEVDAERLGGRRGGAPGCCVPTMDTGRDGWASVNAIATTARVTPSRAASSSRVATSSGATPSPETIRPPASGLQASGVTLSRRHRSNVPSRRGSRWVALYSGWVVASASPRNDRSASCCDGVWFEMPIGADLPLVAQREERAARPPRGGRRDPAGAPGRGRSCRPRGGAATPRTRGGGGRRSSRRGPVGGCRPWSRARSGRAARARRRAPGRAAPRTRRSRRRPSRGRRRRRCPRGACRTRARCRARCGRRGRGRA